MVYLYKFTIMATKLEKDVTRESLVTEDDKEIMITLTKDQKITLKLKGKRSGAVSISIENLYAQLTGKEVKSETNSSSGSVAIKHSGQKPTKKNPMILLSDLRSANAISTLDYEAKAKFDQIIKNLMRNM